jgi:prepilin-type N-terminal cleavage/methylation domain-containing protein
MCLSLVAEKMGKRGFSLVELLVVLGLLLLTLALAVPGFRSLVRGGETERAARDMYLALRVARWKAVASGCRTRIVPAGGAYRMEREGEGRWVADGKIHRLPKSVGLWTTGPADKIFNPNGTCSMGSIVLTGEGGRRSRLSLNPATGRVRLWRGGREVAP